MSYADHNGVRIHDQVEGNGPSLALPHVTKFLKENR